MTVRVLADADIPALFDLRLRSLREHPEAFSSSYEEEARQDRAERAARYRRDWAKGDDWVVGAFLDQALVGIAGYHRESYLKGRHKALVWGVYVAPEARGRGLGRGIFEELIRRSRTVEGLETLNLSVLAENRSARDLYLAMGFEPYAVEPRALKIGDDYIDEEFMALDLRS